MDKKLLLDRSGELPAWSIADAVSQTLREQQAVVITAPPGAGKSTLLPLTLMLDAPVEGKILMLEPRRLAARQIAERMAELLGEPVGKRVGYRIRFDTCVSKDTKIEVLTEGILTRMLQNDPTLDGVGIVIFDEFHERNLHSDLALALSRQAQQLLRPDLRLVIMSATIDASAVCQALQAPLIESQGRMFPVEVHYSKEDTSPRDMPQVAAHVVRQALKEQEGDILVFLPGQADIVKCAEMLQGSTANILPLYGNLSPAEQRRAILPSRDGERKVVIATPIAETSLTIEGVRTVIDSGLCRTLVFDGRTGLSHLETVTISMDMAKQRAGRAGRLAPGTCYRLWTKAAEHRMAEQRMPEIVYADLAPLLLDVAAFGEPDAAALPWLTKPPVKSLAEARQLLLSLGAIDEKGITPLGKRMAALPCHPRIARMILRAAALGMTSLACDIAALLEEKDPLAQNENEADIALRISQLQRARRHKSFGQWQRIAQVAEAYRKMMKVSPTTPPLDGTGNGEPFPLPLEGTGDGGQFPPPLEGTGEAGPLLAYAYPERIAMQIDRAGHYRLASGDEVCLDRSDPLSSYPWLVFAKTQSVGVANKKASPLRGGLVGSSVEPSDIEELASQRDLVAWDSGQDCLLMQREWRFGRLLLRSKPIHDAPRDLQEHVICDAVAKNGLSLLSWSDEVSALQRRVAQVAAWHPELNLPDLSTPHLLAAVHDWLPYYIYDGERLRTTGAALRKIDLSAALWALIPYDLQQQIERIAPSHVVVPTGSHIRLDYRVGAEAPVLSVRLQECFGMKETPRVNEGKVPVLMELLSPGYKPVQLTSDLSSFWQNTYFEVRGELRRRYPKHYWPDNPLEAEAVRGTKRSGQNKSVLL